MGERSLFGEFFVSKHHRQFDIEPSATMKSFLAISALFVLAIGYSQAVYIPSYVVPCNPDDAKFQECALEHGRNAIPYLVKGDKKLKMRPLDPLDIPEIDINTSGHLKIHLVNSKLRGLGKMQLNDMNFDVEKQNVRLHFFSPQFDIAGTYNISGQVLILPIRGNGNLQASLYNAEIGYEFNYDLIERDGKRYVRPQPPSVTLDASRSSYHLDNLFNGDKQLGDEMNKFLNENDDVMFKEIGPSIRETISAIAQDIVEKIITTIPYEELWVH